MTTLYQGMYHDLKQTYSKLVNYTRNNTHNNPVIGNRNITRPESWKKIASINIIWACLDKDEIMVQEIIGSNVPKFLDSISGTLNDMGHAGDGWSAERLGQHIDTTNVQGIVDGLTKSFGITVLILNHDGSHQLIESGEDVIMFYRFTDTNLRIIGIQRNQKIYRYLQKHSFDFQHIMDTVPGTGVGLYYDSFNIKI